MKRSQAVILEMLAVGPLQCNCYLIGDEGSREAILIDPGDEADRILEWVQQLRMSVRRIVHTHAHFDHIGASASLAEATGAPCALHLADRFLLDHLKQQTMLFGMPAVQAPLIEQELVEGQWVGAGRVAIEVRHTPGHSPGSVCFYLPGDSPILFTGDTLFSGSIGRTDLWGGDYKQILESIQTRLLTLPDETPIYPGHGSSSTIGRERRHNPFLGGL